MLRNQVDQKSKQTKPKTKQSLKSSSNKLQIALCATIDSRQSAPTSTKNSDQQFRTIQQSSSEPDRIIQIDGQKQIRISLKAKGKQKFTIKGTLNDDIIYLQDYNFSLNEELTAIKNEIQTGDIEIVSVTDSCLTLKLVSIGSVIVLDRQQKRLPSKRRGSVACQSKNNLHIDKLVRKSIQIDSLSRPGLSARGYQQQEPVYQSVSKSSKVMEYQTENSAMEKRIRALEVQYKNLTQDFSKEQQVNQERSVLMDKMYYSLESIIKNMEKNQKTYSQMEQFCTSISNSSQKNSSDSVVVHSCLSSVSKLQSPSLTPIAKQDFTQIQELIKVELATQVQQYMKDLNQNSNSRLDMPRQMVFKPEYNPTPLKELSSFLTNQDPFSLSPDNGSPKIITADNICELENTQQENQPPNLPVSGHNSSRRPIRISCNKQKVLELMAKTKISSATTTT